jgi:hypothetical protein
MIRYLAALCVALLCSSLASAATAPKAPRRVTRPISSITVKVMPDVDYQRKAKGADKTVTANGKPAPWILTTLDADSCTAWVSTKAPDVTAAEVAAFRAFRVAIDKTVDGAAARSGI